VEQTWLDEETALKAAALKGVGGSSPSCSAKLTGMCLQPLSREFVEYKSPSTVALAAAVYIPVVSLIGMSCWLTIPLHVPIGFFLRDVASIANLSPLAGLLSNVGVLLWCATTTICLFTSRLMIGGGDKAFARFFLAFGVFSGMLMIDDLWLIHEYWWRQLHPLLKTIPLEFAYIVVLSVLLLVFRRVILVTKWQVLGGALLLFSFSVGVDLFASKSGRWHQLIEDGPKLLGIAGWFIYFLDTALRAALVVEPAQDRGYEQA